MVSQESIALIVLSGVIVFLGWYISVWIYKRTRMLGLEHDYSFVDYFDAVVKSLLAGAIVGRAVWIAMNLPQVMLVGFGILPYERVGRQFEWFTVYPWRFLRLNEGFNWTAFWPIVGLYFLLTFIYALFKLIRQLRVGKLQAHTPFYIRYVAMIILTIVYFSIMTYFSL